MTPYVPASPKISHCAIHGDHFDPICCRSRTRQFIINGIWTE